MTERGAHVTYYEKRDEMLRELVQRHDAHLAATIAAEVRGADHCHGLVVRDGEEDACGKPPVALIDGRGTESETFWPACAYHANRYGGERCVPLLSIAAALFDRRVIPPEGTNPND